MPGVKDGMGSSIMESPSELLLGEDCIAVGSGGGGGGGGIIVDGGSSGRRKGGSIKVASPSFRVGKGRCSTPPPMPECEREPASRLVKVEFGQHFGKV